MIKIAENLSVFRKIKAGEMKQKLTLQKELKLQRICQKVAKTCDIRKPVNYSVNSHAPEKFSNLDLLVSDDVWAPWSFIKRFTAKR